MDISTLPAVIGFTFVATMTPGPNNIMVLASGVNFGFQKTVPHLMGIVLGFSFMIVVAGAGVMTLFLEFPFLRSVFEFVSAVYLVILAWKIACAPALRIAMAVGSPLSFLQAAAFQWVNPKAWAMGMSAITLYAPSHSFVSLLLIAIFFIIVGLPAISIWALSGRMLRDFLSDQVRHRAFNACMAIFLVASLYPLIF